MLCTRASGTPELPHNETKLCLNEWKPTSDTIRFVPASSRLVVMPTPSNTRRTAADNIVLALRYLAAIDGTTKPRRLLSGVSASTERNAP